MVDRAPPRDDALHGDGAGVRREHAEQLVRDVRFRRRGLGAPARREREGEEEAEEEELRAALGKAWAAWDFGMRNRSTFGAKSFALIGLRVVCDMLEMLEKLEKLSS